GGWECRWLFGSGIDRLCVCRWVGDSRGRGACRLGCSLSEKRDCPACADVPCCPDSRPQYSSPFLAYSLYSRKLRISGDSCGQGCRGSWEWQEVRRFFTVVTEILVLFAANL